uniref:Uncharacterized protein n=1 Tax=Anopheles coluzzii TaxID=1518534 RepID=A0A8W7PNV3_ANOCL
MQNTYVQTGETVPAEDVLAPFAHHLRAALVLLDRHGAHRAALDEIIVERDAQRVRLAIHREAARIFLARHRWMPLHNGRKKERDTEEKAPSLTRAKSEPIVLPGVGVVQSLPESSGVELGKTHKKAELGPDDSNKFRTQFRRPEQKSSRHVGQCTAHGDGMLEDDGDSGTIRSEQIEEPVWFAPAWSPVCCSLGPTRQIVSQPAFGHQVRNRSSSTSVKEKEYKRFTSSTLCVRHEAMGCTIMFRVSNGDVVIDLPPGNCYSSSDFEPAHDEPDIPRPRDSSRKITNEKRAPSF